MVLSQGGGLRIWCVGVWVSLGLASLFAVSPATALASANATWNGGIEAPLPADGKSFVANVNAVSCPSAGNCGAVGYYTNTATPQEDVAMALNETSGSWPAHATAVTLPANADPASAMDQFAPLDSVSCASVGNCSAVGSYYTSQNDRGMLVSEQSGVWKPAIEAQLPTTPATGTSTIYLTSVSCPSPGNCSAIGYYRDTSGNDVALLLSQVAGVWHKGVAALLPAGAATTNRTLELVSVSCVSAGNCAAVGDYTDGSGNSQGLLVNEVGGHWHSGIEAVLPKGAVTSGQSTNLKSVSCASAGTCSAVGEYTDGSGNSQGLLVNEVAGQWHRGLKALPPTTAAPNPFAQFYAVSCATAGNCSAVGNYEEASGNNTEGLLVNEVSGKWQRGIKAPLPSGAHTTSQDAVLNSVSCVSPGNCTAVDNYRDQSDIQQGFMVSETSGKWQKGIEAVLPANQATAAPNVFFGDVNPGGPAVSCGAEGSCTAVGTYLEANTNNSDGLLLTTSPSRPALSASAPSAGKVGRPITPSLIAAKLTAGSAPVGTIAFRVFGPQPSPPTACISGGRTVGSATVSGNRTYHPSAGFTPAKAGDYWWYAAYGGDGSDLAAASKCGGATMAKTVVK